MSACIEIAEELAMDKFSGSIQITRKFLRKVKEIDIDKSELHRCFDILIDSHTDMAALKNAYRVLERVPDEGISTAIAELLRSLERAPKKISAHFAKLLPDNAIVMTYSQSGTVGEAFIEAQRMGKLSGVILSEGRPDLEGRKFAEFFALKKIPVTITIDIALGQFVDSVDAVAIGADAVTPEYIVNKIGTNQLAMLANRANKPIYALASTHKFAQYATNRKIVQPESIWENPPKDVDIQSPLFEKIPLAQLTAIICEKGLMSMSEIERMLK